LNNLPVFYKKNIAIFGADFRKWLKTSQQETMTAKKMGLMMRGVNCDPAKIQIEVNGKVTTRNVWILKEGF